MVAFPLSCVPWHICSIAAQKNWKKRRGFVRVGRGAQKVHLESGRCEDFWNHTFLCQSQTCFSFPLFFHILVLLLHVIKKWEVCCLRIASKACFLGALGNWQALPLKLCLCLLPYAHLRLYFFDFKFAAIIVWFLNPQIKNSAIVKIALFFYFSIIEVWSGACHFRTRRCTRMIGWWKLSAPHAPLKVSLSVSTCSHSLCLPHKLSPRTTPLL